MVGLVMGTLCSCSGQHAPQQPSTIDRPAIDAAPTQSEVRTTSEDADTHLRLDDPGLTDRGRALIRIGHDGIATENPAALEAYFHPDFRFHGPGGAELNREQLWAYFASIRRAMDGLTVERQAIIDDGGPYVTSRTRFDGVFTDVFDSTPVGSVQPTGQPFGYSATNIFRFHEDGRLIEEWVQYDRLDQLAQLGVEVGDAARAVR